MWVTVTPDFVIRPFSTGLVQRRSWQSQLYGSSFERKGVKEPRRVLMREQGGRAIGVTDLKGLAAGCGLALTRD